MRLCSWQNIVRLGEIVAVCHDCGDVAPTVDLGGKHDGLCGLEVQVVTIEESQDEGAMGIQGATNRDERGVP